MTNKLHVNEGGGGRGGFPGRQRSWEDKLRATIVLESQNLSGPSSSPRAPFSLGPPLPVTLKGSAVIRNLCHILPADYEYNTTSTHFKTPPFASRIHIIHEHSQEEICKGCVPMLAGLRLMTNPQLWT
ncbi:hypothetical protein CHS0354_026014 [Potamilus streckersoni]|uniref:Uncharacterized protein n=1 Tax=Potamilus streckersoni TaxID=2493646 RepID=A0AAE0SBE0_9BIVA|nr:hypothetical protein CHS0354_026014 [Potamilus streckersoni]